MSAGDIQRVINNASVNDIVVFSKGTYNLSNSLSIMKSINIEGETTNPSDVVLLMSQSVRHISATTGKVRIQNIHFRGNPNNSNGGIEYVGQDSLIVDNCEFYQNRNADGGAIYSFGHLQVTKSLFNSNIATGNGGAVYSRGKASFSDCYFYANQSTQGAGIFNQSRSKTRIEPVELYNCIFLQNAASLGGGICSENPVEATNCNFVENKAGQNSGGALFSLNTVTVSASSFYRNEAQGRGGGIFSRRFVSVSESYFVQNRSGDGGGGIYSKPETTSNVAEFNLITSCIFSENEARGGAGSYFGLSSIIRDCYYENNRSYTSGGGILSENDLLLDRTCFEGNSASTEGGGIDALSAKVMNTSMFGNSAQNASAVHVQHDATIVLSTFSGNRASLKTGGIIYGNNVNLYGSIISGNSDQDKVTGKVRANEYNLIKNNPFDIFQETNSNGEAFPSKNPGNLPVLLIRNGGNAYKKIPYGQLGKWEQELGVIDFFKNDQLGNPRDVSSSVDIGAAVYASRPTKNVLPNINIPQLLATIKKPGIQTQREQPNITSQVQSQPQSQTQSYASEEKQKQEPVKTSKAASSKTTAGSSTFDDDLDRMIDAIFHVEETTPTYANASPKTSTPTYNNNNSSHIQPNQSRQSDQNRQSAPPQVKNTDSAAKTEKTSSPGSKTTTAPAISITGNPLSSNTPLEGAYTINSKLPFGGRNFSSLEEAINTLNSKGNTGATQFLISPDVYIIDRPLTISNASFPIHLIKNREEGDVFIRSSGNNRVIVVAVSSPVKMEDITFEGPDVDSQGRNVRNGGGISCNTNATLTFERCIFRYNKNQMGGCIFARSVFVSRCAFYDNISSEGGAIYATECTAVNSTFYRNKSAVGGGIYAKDRAIAALCTFTQNETNGKAAAIFAPTISLYGSIVAGNKSKFDFDGKLHANFSNVLGNINLFNLFADIDDKEEVKLRFSNGNPVVMVKPGSVATEQISESLLRQWEDELELPGFLMIDQEGKSRPQNRNAEIGAWEIPDKRGN